MTDSDLIPAAEIITRLDDTTIQCCGAWVIAGLAALDKRFHKLTWPAADTVTLDGSELIAMDSAGAWLLQKCITGLEQDGKTVTLSGFQLHFQLLRYPHRE